MSSMDYGGTSTLLQSYGISIYVLVNYDGTVLEFFSYGNDILILSYGVGKL